MFDRKKIADLSHDHSTRNLIIFCIVVAVLFGVALVSGQLELAVENNTLKTADAEFQVHVLDVGQGDSILVVADGHAMLIDAGEESSGSTVVRYLQRQEIEKLDYAVATHPHSDHIGGFPAVLEAVKVGRIVEADYPAQMTPTGSIYKNFLTAVKQEGARFGVMTAGDTFSLGNAKVTVLAPEEGYAPEDLNNASLVLRVEYQETACILTGDMEEPEEQAILQSGAEISADLLKVGHHGSEASTSQAFLDAVDPQYAVISCGRENSYGHPAKGTLERIRAVAEKTYITANDGTVVYLFDADTGESRISVNGR